MIKKITKISILIGASSFALLSACASVPPPIKKTAAIDVKNIETTNSYKGIAGNWPKEEWWLGYKDSQLNGLIYEALSNSPSIEIAQARIQQAIYFADIIDATSGLQATANGSPYFQKQSYNSIFPKAFAPKGFKDYGQITIDAKRELDVWGKKRSQLTSAISLIEAARADEANVRVALSTAIASEYSKLITMYHDKSDMQELLGLKQDYAELINLRVKNGLDLKSKTDLANAEINSIKLMIKRQDEMIALQKNAISSLIGHGPEWSSKITQPNISVNGKYGLPQDLKAELVARRPDITAAKLRVVSTANTIEVKVTQYYPNISINGSVGLNALGLDRLFDNGSLIGQFGPAVTLPIFAKKALDSSLRSAEADYNFAVANYNQAVINAFNEVGQIAISYRALNDEIASADAVYKDTKAAYELIKKRKDGGLATNLDVINSKSALLNARTQKTNLEDRAMPLEIALIKALGGGYNQSENNMAKQ